jgi:D-cysteine desulfhydrase
VSAPDDARGPLAPPGGWLALERRFPGLAGRLAWCRFTELPTPVGRLERLGRAAGIDRLWIKRDDRSGPLYGGNKPRKLEPVLGAVVRRGRRSVLTFGALGSHHALATTILAREIGLRTRLVLIPQPPSEAVRAHLLLDHAFGAELHFAPTVARAAATALRLLARHALAGDLPALVPAGGSSPAGALGYVNAALELAEQVRAGELPEPDAIFVALGSGGTVAGLALGLRLAGLRSRVVGVLVSDIVPPGRRRLTRLAGGALARLRRADPAVPAVAPRPDDVTPLRGFVGPRYGAPTPAAGEACRLMEEREGIRLETTYTAKCLAALLALGREVPWRGRTLLFWNTFSAVDPAARLARLPEPDDLPPPFRRLALGRDA